MNLRRIPVLVIALGVGAATLLSGPPATAAAASPGSVTVTTSGFTVAFSSSTVYGAIGDTFDLVNSTLLGTTVTLVNNTGTAEVLGSSCTGAPRCQVANGATMTVTITAYGVVKVDNGATPANLTLAAPMSSTASSEPYVAPKVASNPPSVAARPGDGIVELAITPGGGGTGTARKFSVVVGEATRYICDPLCRQVSQPQVSYLVDAESASSVTSTTIGGLTNERLYSFVVSELNSDSLWSVGTGVSATPSAGLTCTTFSVDVAQPNGAGADTVTTPVTSVAPAVYPFIAPPYGGRVHEAAKGTWSSTTSTGSAGGEYAAFRPSTNAPCPIRIVAAEGLRLSLVKDITYDGGVTSLDVFSNQLVYAFGTKVGTFDITFTAGSGKDQLTATTRVRVGTVPAAAYSIVMTPVSQSLVVNGFGTVKVSVSDVFGNAVPDAKVAVSATRPAEVSTLVSSEGITVGASGSQDVTIAGGAAGVGTVTAAPPNGSTAWAWQAGYTKPSGFPDPVKSAGASITVTAPTVDKTISIIGERGSADVSLPIGETCRSYVEGAPAQALPVGCVKVTGVTTGFSEGDVMTPEYRFPGQTDYTAGIDVTINADGEFTWFRKTGKKIYVRFVNGDTVSSRVIIPAK